MPLLHYWQEMAIMKWDKLGQPGLKLNLGILLLVSKAIACWALELLVRFKPFVRLTKLSLDIFFNHLHFLVVLVSCLLNSYWWVTDLNSSIRTTIYPSIHWTFVTEWRVNWSQYFLWCGSEVLRYNSYFTINIHWAIWKTTLFHCKQID